MNELSGYHHITCITSSAEQNHIFYTKVLGMRLLKKTVNQDDVTAYHLFFGDEMASPGNDLTFFDFPNSRPATRGTNSISSVGLRVPSDQALEYWKDRFTRFEVKHEAIDTYFGVKGLRFEDFDGLRLRLVSDENAGGFAPGIPNAYSDVPDEYAIVGLGTVELTVRHQSIQHRFLTEDLGFREIATDHEWTRYETGPGGNSSSIHVQENQTLQDEIQGAGSVHHLALRVKDADELNEWVAHIRERRYPNSGFVERHYFQSLYTRIGRILYEFATDTPGFAVDEPLETLGESLSIPPHLEYQRKHIETIIKPLDTRRIDYGS